MKIAVVFGILIFVSSSCTRGVELKPVPLGPLFHDNNSKVWVVNKIVSEGQNFAPHFHRDKDMIVFYNNGKVLYQAIKTLGQSDGRKGEYSVYSSEKILTFYFKKEKWDFKISVNTQDTINLTPTSSSDYKYRMQLIPFPEL